MQLVQLIHSLNPMHVGCGQGLGTIDRPLIRERTTDYPFIQSSTIKGAVKARAAERGWQTTDRALFEVCFGRDASPGSDPSQGALEFTDAAVLLFPVRSLAGTFAWITCVHVLARFHRWCSVMGTTNPIKALTSAAVAGLNGIGDPNAVGTGRTATMPSGVPDLDGPVRFGSGAATKYLFEGRVLNPWPDVNHRMALAEWAAAFAGQLYPQGSEDEQFWRGWFNSRVVVVSDDTFASMVRAATQVEANIAIDETGVTHEGSLRYTEFLPAETILFSCVSLDAQLKAEFERTRGGVGDPTMRYTSLLAPEMQFGADESKGRGVARVLVLEDTVGAGIGGGNNGEGEAHER